MRIGVGGRAFGVRGGISSRGIGVGVGPLSAGASWRGRRRRSGGGGGFIGFAVVFVALFLAAAWPYLLATYIAVALGAPNPSTARSVAGWVCETLWIAALIGGFFLWATEAAARAREEAEVAEAMAREHARQHAELVASGAVYETRYGNSTVYRHGGCTTNHRSPNTAEKCRQKGC